MEESGSQARKVPVLRSANSLIEDEFDSLPSRFDDEMRLIEAEMERFKRHMISLGADTGPKSEAPVRASSSSRTQTTRTSSRTTTTTTSKKSSLSSGQLQSKPSGPEERVDADNHAASSAELAASSPLVVDNEHSPGGKMMRLRFDLRDFEPEQIVVKMDDNRLQVHARCEQRSPNKSFFTEYNREFLLPSGTQPDQIMSTLSADGVLTIEAPLPNKVH